MFPICHELGRVVGFSARTLESHPQSAKYQQRIQFLKQYPRNALGTAEFKTAGTALICEGQMDVIACHQGGLCHAVAAQGTAIPVSMPTTKKSTPLSPWRSMAIPQASAQPCGQSPCCRSQHHTAVVTLPGKTGP